MLSCVIIDDEMHCVDALVAMLTKKFADKVTIAGTTSDPQKAVELINSASPDIVFLDVEMPGYTGMQVLSHFTDRDFDVIFTTAYDKYALKAIKAEATDYLLKPISIYELQSAIEKCEKKSGVTALPLAKNQSAQKLMLPSTKGTLVADLKDIIRIEADNNYCTIYFTNKPKLVVAKTLKEFEEQLQNGNFFRVHQSHLINLAFVEYYQSGSQDYVILTNQDKIEIARRRKADFIERLSQL